MNVKEYVIIHRSIFNNYMLIRVLENGDTEIALKEPNDIKPSGTFKIDETEFYWTEWADKKLFNDVWLHPEDPDDIDHTMYFHNDFDSAILEMQEMDTTFPREY